MEQYGLYCLDFFDVDERIPVNTPNGYMILSYFHPDASTFSRKLVSWETAAGVDRISPGREKYSITKGLQLMLSHPGKMPFYFEIPHRHSVHGVVFVQPQTSVSC